MFQRILVAIDGSDPSNAALATALGLAKESGGRVKLLHAFDPMDYLTGYEVPASVIEEAKAFARRLLDQAAQGCSSAGVPFEAQLADAPGERLGDVVAREVRDWRADLVVVGTHGRRGLGRLLLGSGAEQVIRLASVPVLVVR